ncbi:hypothetical protein AWB78_07241 [Caballeronia calidae]|uniref:TniQ domain-containing protein n=1 Tax=Caballeronia calidae TaxID=1777139 RepID=A0A158EDQ9_9BURK|nr:TniQ family protein [Caballeronia calidae]SAL05005.1 hypothetical protein AWB78_07241 [Caballeronia calidae]
MAIALFSLLSGETISSNIGRYRDFMSLKTTLPLRERLFGYPCKPEIRLPSGIDHLAAEARHYWQLASEAIINGHTEFHYATLTLSESQREAMRSDMLKLPAGRCSRRSACGWSGELVTRFRYCEDCLSEWKAKGIPAHWMVDHQLPGVYVCFSHSRMVKVTNSGLSANVTDPTVLELKGRADEDVLTRVSWSERSAIDDIAKRSAHYRMSNNNLPSAAAYRELLRDAKFVWANGRTDNHAFVACVLNHFGHEYCRVAGLDRQKMIVWLRNIVDPGRDENASHPLMFIAAESLLNRLCALPGSFVPSMKHPTIAQGTDLNEKSENAVSDGVGKPPNDEGLYRKDHDCRDCSRAEAGWELARSCGLSCRSSDVSPIRKIHSTVMAYALRYRSLVCIGSADDASGQAVSQQPYAVNARFLRWARNAGFWKGRNFSREEIQCMRDRWCSLVSSTQPNSRITSAHRMDPKLYRALQQYDHDWFVEFNFTNRTCRRRLSLIGPKSKIPPSGEEMGATAR